MTGRPGRPGPGRRGATRKLIKPLGAAGLLLSACGAAGQSAPMANSPELVGPSVAVEQAWLHERNPLRVRPDLPAAPDSASITSLDLSYRQPWGAQQLQAYGRLSGVRYSNQAALNHEPYRVGARWELQSAQQLGASVSWHRQQEALEGPVRLDPQTAQRRQQTLEQLGGALQWGTQRRWSLLADAQHDRLQPSHPQVWWPGYEQLTGRLRVQGDIAQQVFWSLTRRQQEGTQAAVEAAPAVVPAVDYRLGVWDLEWSWRPKPGQALSLRGSTGQGRRQSQGSSVSDIQGASAEVHWRPTTPISLQAFVSSDKGQQVWGTQALVEGEGIVLQGASDVRQARLALRWELGRRWHVLLSRQLMERMGEQSWTAHADGKALGSSTPVRWQDRLDRRSLGITWQAHRTVLAQCAIKRESRNGFGATDPMGTPGSSTLEWSDRQWLCSVRWQPVMAR